MKNLYRRYRPLKLEDVVGQEQVIKSLTNSLKEGKVSHAYLFIGPRGCGKTSVARILAHEINDFKYELEDDYIDIIEIDGASNRGIDNIRELREKVMIAPTTGKYKVYIIDEVHMLTKEAFNALLKTLEEPPAHAVFIMATTDAYKVPVTITSRAQVYTFKLADRQVMVDFLHTVANKEKIAITDDALEVIAKRSGGSFRDALSLLDQISTLSKDKITKDMVISAMGLPQDEKVAKLIDDYQNGNILDISKSLKDLLSSGVKAETLAEEIISIIVDSPSPDLLKLLSELPNVRAPFSEAKLLVALTSNVPQTTQHVQPVQPVPSVKSTSTIKPNVVPTTVFSTDEFLEKTLELNDAVHAQLLKTICIYNAGQLDIYVKSDVVRSILSNNMNILRQSAGNVKITIHKKGEQPDDIKKDTVLTQISDIMGGEVQNDGGGSPF